MIQKKNTTILKYDCGTYNQQEELFLEMGVEYLFDPPHSLLWLRGNGFYKEVN